MTINAVAHEILPSGQWVELDQTGRILATLAVQCWPSQPQRRLERRLAARSYGMPLELAAALCCGLVTLGTALLQVGGVL